MIEFEKPRIAKIDEEKDYGKFIVEPLERGYGTTLGNSLRRILLSSLPGAAITNIQIDGVLHEFSTVKGVREDVAQIILNIKGLALKMYGQEEKTLEIDITGPATVTAGDIIVDSDVEILNKEMYICTVSEGATFHARLTVRPGRGYVQADENKKDDMPIGVLPVDSIYTPVRRVNYQVENTRVGRRDDFDKLTIEIWTDGSTVKTWKDVNPAWPAEPIKLYGPDQDSGTYDYFIEEILGKDGKIRKDYSPSSDDNQLVQGVEGDKGALGYFGYAYYLEQKDKLKALSINGISPSDETVKNGTYKPLSRPLYIYINKKSFTEKAQVKSFVQFYIKNAAELVKSSGYVPLDDYDAQEAAIK